MQQTSRKTSTRIVTTHQSYVNKHRPFELPLGRRYAARKLASQPTPFKVYQSTTPITLWKPNASIVDFAKLPTFGQPGFAFVYLPSTVANKMMLARSIYVCIVGMESDERLCRTLELSAQKIYVVRLADSKPCRTDQLPSIATLIDGLLRKSNEEAYNNSEGYAEECLYQAFSV